MKHDCDLNGAFRCCIPGSISGMPRQNYARVILQNQHPIAQTLSDAGKQVIRPNRQRDRCSVSHN